VFACLSLFFVQSCIFKVDPLHTGSYTTIEIQSAARTDVRCLPDATQKHWSTLESRFSQCIKFSQNRFSSTHIRVSRTTSHNHISCKVVHLVGLDEEHNLGVWFFLISTTVQRQQAVSWTHSGSGLSAAAIGSGLLVCSHTASLTPVFRV
jgi:hypothetical protein